MFSLALVALLALQAAAVPTISAVGSKFFYENGTQYYLKGTLGSPRYLGLTNVEKAFPISSLPMIR